MRNELPGSPNHKPLAPLDHAPPGFPFPVGGMSHDNEENTGGGDGVKRIIAAILRYKWLVAATTVLGVGLGLAGSRFVNPVYVTNATIWIQEQGSGSTGQRGPIRSEELVSSYSWLDLLRSQAVTDFVVRKHRLYLQVPEQADRPLFANLVVDSAYMAGDYELVVAQAGGSWELKNDDHIVLDRGQPDMPVGAKLGMHWVPPVNELWPARRVKFRLVSTYDTGRMLSQMVQARMAEQGNFIHMEMRGSDPQWVASILGSTAQRFVDLSGELKRAKLEEVSGLIAEQLDYARSNLQSAEIALKDFQVQNITMPSDPAPRGSRAGSERSPEQSSYFTMRMNLEQLKRDREQIMKVLREAESASLSIDALQLVPSVSSSPEFALMLRELTEKRGELRSLRNRFTDEHPTVRAALREVETLEKDAIPRQAAGLLSTISDQEANLNAAVGSASESLRSIPLRTIEEARLTRNVESAEDLYTRLRQNHEEQRLATLTSVADLRLLDAPAVPQRSESDNRRRMILFAVAAGIGLGLGLAVLLDRIDPSLRYPEEVTHKLGRPIIAGVPRLPSGDDRDNSKKSAQMFEAFRSLRLNILQMTGGPPLTLTVTSPGPGDGKSFVTSRLALAFANLGLRVVLIDGDIRRGTLHKLFNRSNRPGLTDYLAGHVSARDIISKTQDKHLDLIVSGTRTQNGPELLGSRAMPELLAELKSSYDVVLVDTSPLGAGADPFLFGTLTGNVLLVFRRGTTDRGLSEVQVRALERFPVRILGAVLNDVSDTGAYRYYSYLPGYDIEEDDVTSLVAHGVNEDANGRSS